MKEEKKQLTQMRILDCVSKTRISDLGLKMVEKMVLITLCMHIRRDTTKGFQCNPSRDLLSSEIGVEKQSITNAIKTLKRLEYIKVVEEKGTSNTFYINAELILKKHSLWSASFGKELKECNLLTPQEAAVFNAVECKELSHKRNTTGLKNRANTVQDTVLVNPLDGVEITKKFRKNGQVLLLDSFPPSIGLFEHNMWSEEERANFNCEVV